MNPLSRRSLMHGALGLGAGITLGPRGLLAREDLLALAESLRSATDESSWDVARIAIERGVTPGDLLGAVFLAGALDVKPRHVGGKLHCVMMVESAFQLSAGLPARDQYLAALWNLQDLKVSQARDVREHGDWRLGAAPPVKAHGKVRATAAFRQAMDRWDEEAADQAIVDLAAAADRDYVMHVLWPYAARHFAAIGHNIIYAAQVDRTVARLGWGYATPPLRSLVFGLLHQDDGRLTSAWDEVGEFAEVLDGDWAKGADSGSHVEQAQKLALQLQEADRTEAVAAVVAAGKAGIGQAVLWDGLALAASGIVLGRADSRVGTRAALLVVHALTENEAFRHAAGRTSDRALQRRLLLQATAWLIDMRGALRERDCLADPMTRFQFEGTAASVPSLESLWRAPGAIAARRSLSAFP